MEAAGGSGGLSEPQLAKQDAGWAYQLTGDVARWWMGSPLPPTDIGVCPSLITPRGPEFTGASS